MALNLNKGDDNNSKPSTEKKGLNLSKSADASKVKPNLTKDNPAPAYNSKSSNIQTDAKKKSPALIITLAVIIIGIGVFWFMNKNTTNQNKLETAVSAEIQETAPSEANTSQTNQTTDSNNTNAGDHIQTAEVNSTPTSSNVLPTTDATNPNSTELVTDKTNQNSTTNEVPSSISALPSGSIDEKARQVISGAFGNGADRKQALGEDYAEIQAKVNEIYKNKYQ
ncbi:MAG: hypothetical protein ACK48W_08410 [Bacteroidota bacterium]|jgi:hypothetical protein